MATPLTESGFFFADVEKLAEAMGNGFTGALGVLLKALTAVCEMKLLLGDSFSRSLLAEALVVDQLLHTNCCWKIARHRYSPPDGSGETPDTKVLNYCKALVQGTSLTLHLHLISAFPNRN